MAFSMDVGPIVLQTNKWRYHFRIGTNGHRASIG